MSEVVEEEEPVQETLNSLRRQAIDANRTKAAPLARLGAAPRWQTRCELAKAAAAVLSLLRDPLHTDMREARKAIDQAVRDARKALRRRDFAAPAPDLSLSRFSQSGRVAAAAACSLAGSTVGDDFPLSELRAAGLRFAGGVLPLFRRRRRRRRPAGREGFRCVRAADVVVPARCFKTWRVVDRAEERLPGGARGRRLPRRVGLEARRRRRRQGGRRRASAPGDRRGHCPKGPIIGRGRAPRGARRAATAPCCSTAVPCRSTSRRSRAPRACFHHRKMSSRTTRWSRSRCGFVATTRLFSHAARRCPTDEDQRSAALGEVARRGAPGAAFDACAKAGVAPPAAVAASVLGRRVERALADQRDAGAPLRAADASRRSTTSARRGAACYSRYERADRLGERSRRTLAVAALAPAAVLLAKPLPADVAGVLRGAGGRKTSGIFKRWRGTARADAAAAALLKAEAASKPDDEPRPRALHSPRLTPGVERRGGLFAAAR